MVTLSFLFAYMVIIYQMTDICEFFLLEYWIFLCGYICSSALFQSTVKLLRNPLILLRLAFNLCDMGSRAAFNLELICPPLLRQYPAEDFVRCSMNYVSFSHFGCQEHKFSLTLYELQRLFLQSLWVFFLPTLNQFSYIHMLINVELNSQGVSFTDPQSTLYAALFFPPYSDLQTLSAFVSLNVQLLALNLLLSYLCFYFSKP